MKMPRVSTLFSALSLSAILLSGCDTTAALVTASIGIATFVQTDKTPSDHIASFVTSKDCALLHVADDEPYCQEEAPDAEELAAAARARDQEVRLQLQSQAYCYRTLGAISCYREPDPLASGYALVQ